ncbi:hypothetical protein PN36_12250 [Candidatus Thiomargarita nelsonii]|uniref:Tetratricopeptide repeat protein n=1 Tax=Candidatus Thiomargarita nelsonii TaxID=1003181 RepID=A0A0A6PBX3_9GAMM|nr:hypothetical protein PN36_12250 [Candidatus Thiomargarita nelsonii]
MKFKRFIGCLGLISSCAQMPESVPQSFPESEPVPVAEQTVQVAESLSAEQKEHLRKFLLGEKHPDTLLNLNDLAMIYQDLGHLSDALPLLIKKRAYTS